MSQKQVAEALSLGILNRVVPDDQLEAETMKWAERMATGPTEALGRTKLLINSGYKNQLDQHLAQESALVAETARTEDFREAVKLSSKSANPISRVFKPESVSASKFPLLDRRGRRERLSLIASGGVVDKLMPRSAPYCFGA